MTIADRTEHLISADEGSPLCSPSRANIAHVTERCSTAWATRESTTATPTRPVPTEADASAESTARAQSRTDERPLQGQSCHGAREECSGAGVSLALGPLRVVSAHLDIRWKDGDQ